MLDPHVEYDHRGGLLKYYGFQDNTHHIEPLQCRTPNEYWMIHPCKGILPLTFILINNDTRASDDLMCLASFICRF
jgi:hypothetical protein